MRMWDNYKVDLPEIDEDGVVVRKFTVSEKDARWERLRSLISGSGRGALAGDYTKLLVDGHLWMSDTSDEIWDHYLTINRVERPETKRVLINGLGLGMVVKAALDALNVEHIDVVEKDPRVAKIIGKYYASDRCTIHTDDALTIKWPKGMKWDVAYHDIWPTITQDNLAEMGTLHRRYGKRVSFQDSWCFEQCQDLRRRGY
jgi:hypothetical protein